MKNLLLFALLILTQCAWDFPGWETNYPIAPAAIKYPGQVATTNITLTAAQTGKTIVFNNSTGVAQSGTQFTLPTATVGLEYTVISDVAFWFYVKPQSTDTINFSTATAGQRVSNSASAIAGDSIELICLTANKWSVRAKVGTWAVGPGQ